MVTLKESLTLAGENMLSNLSLDWDHFPFWSVSIGRDLRAKCNMDGPGHNVGRWWDAMLRLEAATGFAIPEPIEAAMLRNLEICLDNPFGLSGHTYGDSVRWVFYHSQRETMLALAVLARYRNSAWAAEAGATMIQAHNRFLRDDGMWDNEALQGIAAEHDIPLRKYKFAAHEKEGVYLTHSHGRLIEALLEFHMATNDASALDLASRCAEYHYEHSTLPDGTCPREPDLHTHSLFGTYRGLLMYGQLARRNEFVERVAKTYEVTVRPSIKRSGFVSHDWGADNRGETASAGDAAQLALWLAQVGYDEYLDDAQRYVRARILPSQITEPLGLVPSADDDLDAYANLDTRAVGAYGGMHRHPHGEALPTTDITAACLHTLCDIYTHVVEPTELGLRINFHFDYEDDDVRVGRCYGDTGRLSVLAKKRQPLLIRVPGWAPDGSVRLMLNGQIIPLAWIGRSLLVGPQAERTTVEAEYALPEETVTEPTDGVDYRISWRGDEVVGISPNTDFIPFYPTLPA